MIDRADIENRFHYHAPDAQRVQEHQGVRQACETLAIIFNTVLPDGREKSLALTKLEEGMFWANAAIARQGPTGEEPDRGESPS